MTADTTPATKAPVFYVFLDKNGNEVSRKPRSKGRPPLGTAKAPNAEGNFEVTYQEPKPVKAPKAAPKAEAAPTQVDASTALETASEALATATEAVEAAQDAVA